MPNSLKNLFSNNICDLFNITFFDDELIYHSNVNP